MKYNDFEHRCAERLRDGIIKFREGDETKPMVLAKPHAEETLDELADAVNYLDDWCARETKWSVVRAIEIAKQQIEYAAQSIELATQLKGQQGGAA